MNSDFLYQKIKHLTPKGIIIIEGLISIEQIEHLIQSGYKVIIFGDYPINENIFIHLNPVYRPLKFRKTFNLEISSKM